MGSYWLGGGGKHHDQVAVAKARHWVQHLSFHVFFFFFFVELSETLPMGSCFFFFFFCQVCPGDSLNEA